MRRLTSTLLAILIVLAAGTAAAARQITPPEIQVAPGITAAPLVMAGIDALPADSSLVLFARDILLPGTVVTPSTSQSVGLFYVESGTLTVTGRGGASILRAGEAEMETIEPDTEPVLAAGDALSIGVCVEAGFRNDGAEPVSLLTAGVSSLGASDCPSATPAADTSEIPGVTTQFLAAGRIDPPPALPARLAITRLTYDPGASDPAPAPNDGTVLAHIESGSFAMTIESGEGVYVPKPADPNNFFGAQQEPFIEGIEATLNPGDLLWQKSGTVFQARNPGTEPASVLIFVLDAASTEPATPTS